MARADRLSELSGQQRPQSAGAPKLTPQEREARVRQLLREREAKRRSHAAAAEVAQSADGARIGQQQAATRSAIPDETAAAIRRAAGGAATSSGRAPVRPSSAPRQRPMSALGITVPQAPPLSAFSGSKQPAGRHSRQAVIAAVEARAQEELTFKPKLVASKGRNRPQSAASGLSPTGDARIEQARCSRAR